jgi:hypothetical protein
MPAFVTEMCTVVGTDISFLATIRIPQGNADGEAVLSGEVSELADGPYVVLTRQPQCPKFEVEVAAGRIVRSAPV